jgi:glyoxylase I family protein
LLNSSNAYLRLLQPTTLPSPRTDQRPVAEAGIVHVCLQSPSIDDLYSRFSIANATFHAPPVDLGTGYLYSYARDNEANVVELEGVPPVWGDTAPWVAHVSFSSHDVDRLADFYADIFAHPATKSPRLGPSRRMDAVSGMKDTEFKAAWIPAGNMQVEVIQYLNPPTLAHRTSRALSDIGYSYVALEVADLDKAVSHLLAQGAIEADALAHMCTDRQYFCADPDGNILLLVAIDESDQAHSIAALPDPTIVTRMALRREELLNSKKLKAANQ